MSVVDLSCFDDFISWRPSCNFHVRSLDRLFKKICMKISKTEFLYDEAH